MRVVLQATDAELACPDCGEQARAALRAALETAGVAKGRRGGEVAALDELESVTARALSAYLADLRAKVLAG